MAQWLAENWFNLISTVFGGGGLWFTAFSIRKDAQARREEAKARRISNLLAITANYREIWKEFFSSLQLSRVIDPTADVATHPITPAEESFINLVISHTSSTYEALKEELLNRQEGLRRDVRSFYSLPIPQAVWHKTKPLQNQDFAAFIDSSLK